MKLNTYNYFYKLFFFNVSYLFFQYRIEVLKPNLIRFEQFKKKVDDT